MSNAIAFSPPLDQVTSRAISMCVDHVNLTLNTLEEIEEEEKALGPRPLRKTDTNDDADEDDRSRFDPDGELVSFVFDAHAAESQTRQTTRIGMDSLFEPNTVDRHR